jgi:serine/threonine-protein kinase
LPGTTLADEIRAARPLTEERVCTIAVDVLDALAAAHALGVLHRDLKPANVLMTSDGRPKITDFGIATSDTITEITASGLVIGTPAYLAPERVEGKSATAQSDIYSAGVLCYEAATGTRPFAGESPIAVAHSILHDDPKPLRTVRPDLSPHFEAVVMRAIARDAHDRFASAAEFRDALATVDARADADATMPIAVLSTRVMPRASAAPRHSRRPLVAIAVVAALLLAGAFLMRPTSSPLPKIRQRPVSATTTVTRPPAPPTTAPALAPPQPNQGGGDGHGKGHGKGNDKGD